VSERVAIVGVAQTRYQENRADARVFELTFEVVARLLQETGLSIWKDVDAVVTSGDDYTDGKGISDAAVTEVVGAQYRAEEKVAADGAFAVRYAMLQILSGHYDSVLVAAHCKESKVNQNLINNLAFDPIYQRYLGLDFLSAAALQAQRYMYKYGITPEHCAQVVVKNLGNAKKNPYAQRARDITVEEVVGSPLVCDPLRTWDCKPISDGACALILAREEKAKAFTDKPVWITGVGSCYDAFYLGDRELADCDSLVEAAKRAYKMAGISDPRREIDVAEISEECSYQELLWTEGLGLCQRGEGGKLIASGATSMGGEIPVNPSGGVLSGCPNHVAGLARVAEAALQLRGEADARQVPGAKVALAHGITGACGQLQCVLILSS